MPRHPRLFLPEATYHVYCRVARGEFVFDDDFEAVESIEALLNKHGNSVTNWLNQGLLLAGNDPVFNKRLDHLDAAISLAI